MQTYPFRFHAKYRKVKHLLHQKTIESPFLLSDDGLLLVRQTLQSRRGVSTGARADAAGRVPAHERGLARAALDSGAPLPLPRGQNTPIQTGQERGD